MAIKILISIILYSTCLFSVTNQITITTDDTYRYIKANGIPNHPTGEFPNRYNPNQISEQTYDLKVPLYPTAASTITANHFNPFGIALNGILFDAKTADFWNNNRESGWNYDAFTTRINLGLDENNAHVQPNGAYHYHGLPTGLLKELQAQNQQTLIGYAADGFPIYNNIISSENGTSTLKSSYQLKQGTRPSGPLDAYDGTFIEDFEYIDGSGDLDEANGYYGITKEYPKGTYFYVISDTYPNVPRYFKGIPDNSFKMIKSRQPLRGGHPSRKPPRHHRYKY